MNIMVQQRLGLICISFPVASKRIVASNVRSANGPFGTIVCWGLYVMDQFIWGLSCVTVVVVWHYNDVSQTIFGGNNGCLVDILV